MTVLCKVMEVSRSGYYAYVKRRQRPPDPEQAEQICLAKRVAQSSLNTYGTRRMAEAMSAMGYHMGRYRARGLMRRAAIQVQYRKRFKVTTDSDHPQPIHDNLLDRDFAVTQPNRVWVSDITYIWTHQGWLYLAVIIDLYSRRVVGWAMGARINAALVGDALEMAVGTRKPPPGLIFHSDRGVQYASRQVRQRLDRYQMLGSMSRKGDCWDNAVAESFFGTLKNERIHWRRYLTRDEARRDVVNYITMFYNPRRLHSYLNYRSPMDFEAAATGQCSLTAVSIFT